MASGGSVVGTFSRAVVLEDGGQALALPFTGCVVFAEFLCFSGPSINSHTN